MNGAPSMASEKLDSSVPSNTLSDVSFWKSARRILMGACAGADADGRGAYQRITKVALSASTTITAASTNQSFCPRPAAADGKRDAVPPPCATSRSASSSFTDWYRAFTSRSRDLQTMELSVLAMLDSMVEGGAAASCVRFSRLAMELSDLYGVLPVSSS